MRWDQGLVDQDVLALLEVDVPDAEESRAWLRAYARDVLRPRFRQKAIYLKFVVLMSRGQPRRATPRVTLLAGTGSIFSARMVSQ